MSRKILFLPSALLFMITFFLFVTTTTGFALGEQSATLRTSYVPPVKYVQRCELPYNISDYGYETGLHIISEWPGTVSFTFVFFSGGDPYAITTKNIPAEGLTVYAKDLLPKGKTLKFPTLIYVDMHDPTSGTYQGGVFWVTQFLFTNSGFSHQTFTSHPYSE